MDPVSNPGGLVPAGYPTPVRGPRPWRDGLVPPMAGAEDPPADPEKDGDKGKDGDKEPQTFSKDYVDALRSEAAGYRTKHRELESKFKELEDKLNGKSEAEKTEAEKAEARARAAEEKAEAAEKRIRSTTTRAAVEREARKLEIVDEDVAYRLLDLEEIEYDSEDRPINLATMLKDLVKAKPFLVGKPAGDKKGVPGTPKGGEPGEKTREQVVELTLKEMAATGKYSI